MFLELRSEMDITTKLKRITSSSCSSLEGDSDIKFIRNKAVILGKSNNKIQSLINHEKLSFGSNFLCTIELQINK